MYFTSEYLDELSSNMEEFGKNQFFMKEQFIDYSQVERLEQLKIKFSDFYVAMSKNGGLIAFCVKQGHYVKELNKKLIVMFQNSEKRYLIKLSWDNLKKYIICMDFTPKQELYIILNDGNVYKVDYNGGKLKQKLSPSRLTENGVISAKFFEKGFIALSTMGIFYYIKDFKNMIAMEIITPIPPFINFDNNTDYMPIPSENTQSKKIELLITRQEGNGGIIIVPLKEDNERVQMVPVENNTDYLEILGVSHVTRETAHQLIVSTGFNTPEVNDKNKKSKKKNEIIKEPPKIENEGTQNEIGFICAIAISPDNDSVAFYNKEKKTAYLFNTDFEGKYQEVHFICKNSDNYDEYKEEVDGALEYPEGCQFLFCGQDTLAISWQRVIILSQPYIKNSLIYISSEENIGKGKLVSKCVTETDGLRVFTNEGIFLISRVPKELYNLSDEFSRAPSKKLIDIYKNTINRKYVENKDIRALSKYLSDAIEELQRASANIFWTENNNEQDQKSTQLFLLQVAQFCKKYADKNFFNFDKFNENCKKIRVVNNLRNDPRYPVFITFKEYEQLDPKDIISILIKYRNFQLAADISKFLDYPMKKVLKKYVEAIMKREIREMEDTLDNNAKSEQIKERYSALFESLERVPGISFVKLAKKANKYGGKRLAMYLLEQEKSDLVKIPMLLQLKSNFEQPIKIAFDSFDFNAVIKVMYSLKKDKNLDVLFSKELEEYRRKILLYYKIYDKKEILHFLEKTKNFVEVYYLKLKTYFKQNTFEERIEALDLCKDYIKKFETYLKKNEKVAKTELFDIKGTKKFLDKLEVITNFQKKCFSEDKTIIHYSEKDPYRVSVYDCFKKGYIKEEANFIETQNKTIQYSQRKLHLIKFRSYLELRRPDAIENQLQKTPLKKLGLSPIHLAEIYYDYKYYDQAASWLIQVKDQNYYDYVKNLFKHMKKYKEWLEFAIACKTDENKADLVNEVLAVSPGLDRFVDEYCAKYKVNLK